MASLIAWGISGHLLAWMIAIPASGIGLMAGVMGVALALYVSVRERGRILEGICTAFWTSGSSLMVLSVTVLGGFGGQMRRVFYIGVVAVLIGGMLLVFLRGQGRGKS